MTFDSATIRVVAIGLIVGVLGASWWVAFDRGRQWREQAEAYSTERDDLAAQVERLRADRDRAVVALGTEGDVRAAATVQSRRLADAVASAEAALRRCGSDDAACASARAMLREAQSTVVTSVPARPDVQGDDPQLPR